MKGWLITEDNERLEGESFGARRSIAGELVFNTAMSGYEEIISDPSYAGQIIVFTYPHIGNTGINLEDVQAKRIHARGIIVRDYVETYSNHRAKQSLATWLKAENVPAISGIDTRDLVRKIRERGCLEAHFEFAGAPLEPVSTTRLVDETMVHEPVIVKAGVGRPIVVLDFGIKQGILDELGHIENPIMLLPGESDRQTILKHNPRAVVYSNGPGDPAVCQKAIETCRELLDSSVPILGICLGFQILTLALSAQTKKMAFGHHGANHPVQELETGRVMITSQNHTYQIIEESLGDAIEVTHRSLFDGTVQGFKHRSKPIMALQGHPEASPGPNDAKKIFKAFYQSLS